MFSWLDLKKSFGEAYGSDAQGEWENVGLVSCLSREDVCVSYPCLYHYLRNAESCGNWIWFINQASLLKPFPTPHQKIDSNFPGPFPTTKNSLHLARSDFAFSLRYMDRELG